MDILQHLHGINLSVSHLPPSVPYCSPLLQILEASYAFSSSPILFAI